jgi:DNA-binding NtrC family response regulator
MKMDILVVDDEKSILALFKRILTQDDIFGAKPGEEKCATRVVEALSGEAALKLVRERRFDLIISDLAMGRMDGLNLLQEVKTLQPDTPFIMLTGVGTVEDAVKAMKHGAFDYLTKPFQHDELMLTIRKALEYHRLHDEVRALRARLAERETGSFSSIIGQSKPMQKIFDMIKTIAKSDTTILIEGESGTGKELIARSIHQESERRSRPFVAINCGAIPETLLESELFGHVKGSFTGAIADKRGLFQEAHGGTLFLDEIATISLPVQAKLLRAIQEREIRPVGGAHGLKIDARIIAATNRPLLSMIREKSFREDLYYRLAVIALTVPPLRDRKEDIPLLATFFLDKFCRKNGKNIRHISEPSMRKMLDYFWPGNIRELENIIERAVVISPDDAADINLSVLPPALNPLERPPMRIADDPISQEAENFVSRLLQENHDLKSILDIATSEIEKTAILQMLKDVDGNRSEAAKRLGISRPALYTKLREYNID